MNVLVNVTVFEMGDIGPTNIPSVDILNTEYTIILSHLCIELHTTIELKEFVFRNSEDLYLTPGLPGGFHLGGGNQVPGGGHLLERLG